MVFNTIGLNLVQNNSATLINGLVTHIALGDDNTTPLISDTSLGNETFRDDTYADSVSSNVTNFDVRLDVTENNGNTIAEIGTFDDDTTGNMYSHNLTTSFAKTSSKEAYYRVKMTFVAEDDS
jgi:hypothetical protein